MVGNKRGRDLVGDTGYLGFFEAMRGHEYFLAEKHQFQGISKHQKSVLHPSSTETLPTKMTHFVQIL